MSKTPYFEALKQIRPFVFRILTPNGSGTGFQISYSKKSEFCGIATAYHVISHAHEWEEPIKLLHFQSGQFLILKHKERMIFAYPDKDLAFILFHRKDLPTGTQVLKLIDSKKILKQGVETGWCGFPSVALDELCFFAGHISCRLDKDESYLVDGVAINGVSGGPAFYIDTSSDEPKICGVITAYRPNRATGETLPGVSVVRSVEQYHSTLKDLKDLEEASEKIEEEQKKREKNKNFRKVVPKRKTVPKGKIVSKKKATLKKGVTPKRKSVLKKKIIPKKKATVKKKKV